MFTDRRFFALLREYARVELATGRDMSGPISDVAYMRVAAKENAGTAPAAALAEVQAELDNERLRFPVVLQPLNG